MSDIFQEVDEEVRRERLKKLWERYGSLLIAACVLLVVAVGGWRTYEWWEAKKAAEAGTAFQAAITLSSEGKTKEAEDAFARLAASGTSSYRMLARFREAAEVARRDPSAAVAIYDRLAADSSFGRDLQDLAALRAGTILVDTAPYSEIVQRLEPLTAPDRTFRHSARSLAREGCGRDAQLVRHDPGRRRDAVRHPWPDPNAAGSCGRRQEELRPPCAIAG